MAHPFFDNPIYPSTRSDAKEFMRVVNIIFPTVADIKLIFDRVSTSWGSIFAVQAPEKVWAEAVQLLCRDGLFKNLCEEIIARPNISPILRVAVQAVIDATDMASPLNKPILVLSDNRFMLDRDPVRQKLALLTDDTALEKILLIRGPKKSGKSHLKFLFEEQAKQVGASFLYLAAGKVTNVRETIDQLFGHFNRLNDVPPVESTPNAWYKKVALKLKEIVATQPDLERRPLWIAMDDLGTDEKGQSILPTDVCQFFDQFALNMDNENFHKWFRLLLINYPDTIPIEWTDEFWTNPDTPLLETDIQAQHVADCLRDWAVGQNRVIPPDDLISRSNGLINTIDEQQSQSGQELVPRLRRIHDELKRTISELKAQSIA